MLDAQLGSFLVGLEEHVDHTGEDNDGRDQADDVQAAGEGVAELIDHQGNEVSKAALIADGEPCPLRVVHLTLDRADGREARSAQQVEHQEGIPGDAGEGRRDILVNGQLTAAVEDTERTDDVLLGDKASDGGDGRLPVAPAERDEDPGDQVADLSKDRGVDLVLREHLERAVDPAKVGGEPHEDSGKQDDGTGLLDERPAALPHAAQQLILLVF